MCMLVAYIMVLVLYQSRLTLLKLCVSSVDAPDPAESLLEKIRVLVPPLVPIESEEYPHKASHVESLWAHLQEQADNRGAYEGQFLCQIAGSQRPSTAVSPS